MCDPPHSGKRPRDDNGGAHSPKRQRLPLVIDWDHPPNTSTIPGPRKKWYTVIGGPNPGIYHATWDEVKPFIHGYRVDQRKHPTEEKALEYWNEKLPNDYLAPALGPSHTGSRTNPVEIEESPQPGPAPRREESFYPPEQWQTYPLPGDFFPPEPESRREERVYPPEQYQTYPLPGTFFPPEPEPRREERVYPPEQYQAYPLPGNHFPPESAPRREEKLYPPEYCQTYPLPDNLFPPESAYQRQPPPPQHSRTGPSDDTVPNTEPILCKEQADLVELILSGRNVFYTGSAGVGKSTVLKAFKRRFVERGKEVVVVAPTGKAALAVGGSTTWTFAGWTPDSHKKSLNDLISAAHGKRAWKRLNDTQILVIDEISMVENLHFERLNALLKSAKMNDRPFGGVQMIVTGDFCQLPPVKPFIHCIQCGRELIPKKSADGKVVTEYKCRQHGIYYDIDKWAFRSNAWNECDFVHVNLTQIHRQNDKVFIDILQKLRIGKKLLHNEVDLLLNHESETRNAVQLFATRQQVKQLNDEMFSRLRSSPRTYQSIDAFKWNHDHGNLRFKDQRGSDGSLTALQDHRYESRMQLKQGMLVILLHNLDIGSGLVNGSQGIIQGFEPFDPKKIPHASEASGGRKFKVNEGEPAIDNYGPTLGGDYATHREEHIRQFTKQEGTYGAWPIVRFLNGVQRTIFADCTVTELGDQKPYSLMSRTQIPLMAAWAVTIHKSQGMTLDRVIVDLARGFEPGQAYVALSRARSLQGLKVISFPASAQKQGNAQVNEFLREKFGIE